MFLVQENVFGNLFNDFTQVYSEKDGFKLELAKKLMADKQFLQTYGLLIDPDLKYSYAFNRKFADYDPKNKKIVFKTSEEILLNLMSNLEEMAQGKKERGLVEFHFGLDQQTRPIDVVPEDDNDDNGVGDLIIKYSLIGDKNSHKLPKTSKAMQLTFEKPSLLERIESNYRDGRLIKLNVIIDGQVKTEDFFLTETSYQTNTFDDFIKTYANSIDSFKIQTAKQVFGETKKENGYGLILTTDLQIIFAFNKAFANYNPESKTVVYIPAEKLLLNSFKEKFDKPTFSITTKPSGLGGQGGPLIRYALIGKKEN
ncbi:MAG: hypothetical protein PHD81_02540 [Candidatus Nanoarchaeia archaeon]|nr:hypothetical protein [Candidatus Nanoarchaeia archaeon]MDD5587964.1 hypothetical protein [Candidatus Nanoarchaeia archaeon]